MLDACYVEPEARGVGIGHLLVAAAVRWFADHGADGIDGIALPGDRQAKNFFESAGFKARMLDHVPVARVTERRPVRAQEARRPWTERAGTGRRGPGGGGIGMPMSRASSGT